MVVRIADNILSPLGATTAENYLAIKEGRSLLRRHAGVSGRQEDDYVASRFSKQQRQRLMVDGLTWFESLVYHSVRSALSACTIAVDTQRTVLILGTTKGNIEHLSSPDYSQLLPAAAATRVARRIGITTQPLVVCNACISGVAAIITAQRLIAARCYDTAIVVGCDVISHFVVSGFQSLKALSPAPCRPFDIERTGLNLGEAAATLVLTNSDSTDNTWQIVDGALRNDAYHISSPSPKGEGCCAAIRYVINGTDPQAVGAVNVHGTATMYNDQMESKAIEAAGLSGVPLNTLKGYFGHTLGASGILETIITMHATAHGELLPTKGFHETGVSGRVNISEHCLAVSQPSFVKIISGFGGNNAALFCRRGHSTNPRTEQQQLPHFQVIHHVIITPRGINIDDKPIDIASTGVSMLTEIYKQHIGSYPRYYKMDPLSQLGFVASELLLGQERPRKKDCQDRAVILFNHTSSGWVDREYAKTINKGEDYYPSPSLFVYTLPNIVCGEIAIRNGYHAETSFYMMDTKDETMMQDILRCAFSDTTLQSIVAGWIDYQDEHTFEAEVKLIRKTE